MSMYWTRQNITALGELHNTGYDTSKLFTGSILVSCDQESRMFREYSDLVKTGLVASAVKKMTGTFPTIDVTLQAGLVISVMGPGRSVVQLIGPTGIIYQAATAPAEAYAGKRGEYTVVWPDWAGGIPDVR